jgi:hypothetical protein
MMLDSDKAYVATARMGVTTETGDSEGKVVLEQAVPSDLTEAGLENVLDSFRGDIQQVPSMYSALKHKGKPWEHKFKCIRGHPELCGALLSVRNPSKLVKRVYQNQMQLFWHEKVGLVNACL